MNSFPSRRIVGAGLSLLLLTAAGSVLPPSEVAAASSDLSSAVEALDVRPLTPHASADDLEKDRATHRVSSLVASFLADSDIVGGDLVPLANHLAGSYESVVIGPVDVEYVIMMIGGLPTLVCIEVGQLELTDRDLEEPLVVRLRTAIQL